MAKMHLKFQGNRGTVSGDWVGVSGNFLKITGWSGTYASNKDV